MIQQNGPITFFYYYYYSVRVDTSFVPVCQLCGTLEEKKEEKKNASQCDVSPSNNTSSTRST